MFNPTEILIDAFVERLQASYRRSYGRLEPDFEGILGWAGRMTLENIANSDALYHDLRHTIVVTFVGQEILRGRHLRGAAVEPEDWFHFVLALLCHDIGFVAGLCRGDRGGDLITGDGKTVTLPPGATDAALAPYHVDRGKLFVVERFGDHEFIDAARVAEHIERTRFPVPEAPEYQCTSDFPGLARAADLIGQLADPNPKRIPALFYEYQETGVNAALGYQNPSDLRRKYPAFFWGQVERYIGDALRHLRVTQEGKQWIAHLYAHVFTAEHADG